MTILLSQEMTDGRAALLAVVSAMIGSAFTALTTFYILLKKTNRDNKKADEKTIIDHMKEAMERSQRECDACHKEVKETQQREVIERVMKERALGHMKYYESLMRQKNIKFIPLPRDPDEPPASGLGDGEQARRATPPEGYPT